MVSAASFTYSYDELYTVLTTRSIKETEPYVQAAKRNALSFQQLAFLKYVIDSILATSPLIFDRNVVVLSETIRYVMSTSAPHKDVSFFKDDNGTLKLNELQKQVFSDPQLLLFYHRLTIQTIAKKGDIYFPQHVLRVNMTTIIKDSDLNIDARMDIAAELFPYMSYDLFYLTEKLSEVEFVSLVKKIDERKQLNLLLIIQIQSRGCGHEVLLNFIKRYMRYGTDKLSLDLDSLPYRGIDFTLGMLNFGVRPKKDYLKPCPDAVPQCETCRQYRYACLYFDKPLQNPEYVWIVFPDGSRLYVNQEAINALFKDSDLFDTLQLDKEFKTSDPLESDSINADADILNLREIKVYNSCLGDYPMLMKYFTSETFQVLTDFYDGKKSAIGNINRKFALYKPILDYLRLKSFIEKNGVFQLAFF